MMQVPSTLRRLTPLLLLVPLVCFTALLSAYALNIPWMDDVESFIGFMLGYLKAEAVSGKLNWLLKPNNEHRILFAKLTTLGLYELTGQINFRWLIFVAYGCLLGLLLLFYRIFRTTDLPLAAFLPVPFLLLQPQYHLTSVWAITGLQHQATVMLTFLAMYLLAGRPTATRFAGATAIQLLASFSMSNGLFGWVAGAGSLLVQRRFKALAAWLLIGAGAIVYYFHDFASPQGNESSFGFFLRHPHLIFFGFFTFLGGLFDFFPEADILPRSVLPTLAGLVLVPLVLYWLKRMLLPWPRRTAGLDEPTARRRYFLVGAYGFLLVNGAVIALLRPRFGYHVMLISNYMIYPCLLAILIYLNGLGELRSGRGLGRWTAGGLVLGLLVWGVHYFRHLPTLAERKQMLQAFAFNQKHNGIGLGATLGTTFAVYLKEWMDGAIRQGLYQYPDNFFYEPYEPALLRPVPARPDAQGQLVLDNQPDSYWVRTENWSFGPELHNACIVAKSARRTYLFPVRTLYDNRTFYLQRPVPGLLAQIIKGSLYPDTYRLGVLMHPDDRRPIQYTDQQITVR